MAYNVGPNFKRESHGREQLCHECDEVVIPEWDGVEGCWICPLCLDDGSFLDYSEED